MSKIDLNQHQQDTYMVICPYCGYEPDETYPEPNGDWETEECGRCEKKFLASAEVSYSSKRDCKANGMECELIKDQYDFLFTESKYTHFICVNCFDKKLVKKETP